MLTPSPDMQHATRTASVERAVDLGRCDTGNAVTLTQSGGGIPQLSERCHFTIRAVKHRIAPV